MSIFILDGSLVVIIVPLVHAGNKVIPSCWRQNPQSLFDAKKKLEASGGGTIQIKWGLLHTTMTVAFVHHHFH